MAFLEVAFERGRFRTAEPFPQVYGSPAAGLGQAPENEHGHGNVGISEDRTNGKPNQQKQSSFIQTKLASVATVESVRPRPKIQGEG